MLKALLNYALSSVQNTDYNADVENSTKIKQELSEEELAKSLESVVADNIELCNALYKNDEEQVILLSDEEIDE